MIRIAGSEDFRFDPPFKDRGQFLEVFVAKFSKIPLESGCHVDEPPLGSGKEQARERQVVKKQFPMDGDTFFYRLYRIPFLFEGL